MTLITRHRKSHGEFEAALVASLVAQGLTSRTAVVRAGPEIYKELLRAEQDGPHTTLRGVGFIGLQLDPGMEPFSAEVVKKET